MRVTVDCEVCRHRAEFWISKHGYRHYRCIGCGHVFVSPQPSQAELDKFYESETYYDKAETQRDRLVREAQKRVAKLDQLRKRYGLSKQLLDVGCASGYFLQQASTNGWNVTGLDRSESLAKQARQRSDAPVFTGLLEQAQLDQGSYSVVTAWEVLEHTIDPHSFFQALARHVAKGGLLVLSTPLANGIPARILGPNFPMLIPPEHLRLFTRKSLNILAAQFGFEEVGYNSFSNLESQSLASGLVRLSLHCRLEEVSEQVRALYRLAGIMLAWAPEVVDWCGWGSEMEIVLQRAA
jgi:2-polyprenyl-3-methyl-5-hydroxy-6-metoxy-1,4-benzoquinol methylase